jgi:hypothetical protein
MTTINGSMKSYQAVMPVPSAPSVAVGGLSNKSEVDNSPSISTKNSTIVTISSVANARMGEMALSGSVSLSVADAFQAANAGLLNHSVIIQDSAANVAGHLKALGGLLSLGYLDTITLTDARMPELVFSKADLGGDLSAESLAVLGKITSPYRLDVTGLSVQDALTLKAPSGAAALSVSLIETAESLGGNLAALDTVSLHATIKDITLVNAPANLSKPMIAVSGASLEQDNAILSKIKGDFDLTITDVPAKDAMFTAGAADKILKVSGSLSSMSATALTRFCRISPLSQCRRPQAG